ncbi:MAG: tim-barrel domain-containing protein [Monoraphidium minutum]|nr:MAG: tim-barrel domain-containing protein [Monoraphidium minutum]
MPPSAEGGAAPMAPRSAGRAAGAGAATGPPGEAAAVAALLKRVLPDHARLFDLRLVPPAPGAPHGHFRVRAAARRVVVEGTSGVELAAGAHWWLKHHAGGSISWDATGGPQAPPAALAAAGLDGLEAAGRDETVPRAVPHTFYQNVVTASYSFAFWDWTRWERELDWMALQGVNLALMPLGAEAVWAAAFTRDLGLPAAALADFFPGPAFLAWGRMGNIQGWGGPLPEEYMAQQLALGRRVVARMRELGIEPVFPAFAGFVPRALAAAYPNARVIRSSNWCRFPEAYCCPLLLDPQDPLFPRIGAAFVTRLREAFGPEPPGRRSFYIADTFNEMRPSSPDPAYLSAVSAAAYAAMAGPDPGCVWVMQAWLFFSDAGFWQPPQIKARAPGMALLAGVPPGRLLLLDLFAEEHPIWTRTDAFYGTPYIWCMLHNFGGNNELYGALPAVAEGVAAAMAASAAAGASGSAPGAGAGGHGGGNLVGVGMAPEGIEQNPVVYEFMAEMAYAGGAAARAVAPHPAAGAPWGGPQAGGGVGGSGGGGAAASSYDEWMEAYALRRYAAAGAPPPAAAAALRRAWRRLGRSAYGCRDKLHNTVCDVPTSRPGLWRGEIVGWGLGPHSWYPPAELRAALGDLLDAADAHPALAASSAFRYDAVDAARELLSKSAGALWAAAAGAYARRDAPGLAAAGAALLALLADMERLLACHEGFMLGPRLAAARAFADVEGKDEGGEDGGAERRRGLALLYEWNLRLQLTIWGTSDAAGDSEVSDYANKEWAGLVGGFYAPRWRAWLARLEEDLRTGRQYDAAAWRLDCLRMTQAWAAATGGPLPPLAPESDAAALARAALGAWGGVLVGPAPAEAAAAAAAVAAVPSELAAVAGAAATAAVAVVAAASAAAAEGPLSPVRHAQQAVRA